MSTKESRRSSSKEKHHKKKESCYHQDLVNVRSQMQQLWDIHIALTREVVLADKLKTPNLDSSLPALLQNQVDLGNNWAQFYGKKAGKIYTSLLTDHINQAVNIVNAALAGNNIDPLVRKWYDNGADIASYLSYETGIDQKFLQKLFFSHLDCTLSEAQNIIGNKYKESLSDFFLCLHHAQQLVAVLSKAAVKNCRSK